MVKERPFSGPFAVGLAAITLLALSAGSFYGGFSRATRRPAYTPPTAKTVVVSARPDLASQGWGPVLAYTPPATPAAPATPARRATTTLAEEAAAPPAASAPAAADVAVPAVAETSAQPSQPSAAPPAPVEAAAPAEPAAPPAPAPDDNAAPTSEPTG